MIAIVDYQAGNIGSVQNMLKKLGAEAVITDNPNVIQQASKIILPGVGAFDHGITQLKSSGIIDILNDRKAAGTPILGICLGAQLMCMKSEEGGLPGLGWIDAEVVRFPHQIGDRKYAVPHIGWDHVKAARPSRLMDGLPEASRFYFVHSYWIKCRQSSDSLARNTYGVVFDAVFESSNIAGVQFHPEKSHKYGFILLRNFLEKF